MRKWLGIGGVVLLIAVGVAFFYARPLLAIRDLKIALQARDPKAVTPLVDFPTLKANVTASGKEKVEQKNDGKMLEGLRNWIGDGMVDDAMDRIATPEGLIRLACDSKTDGLPTAPGTPCAFGGHVQSYRYLSGDRFRIDVRKKDGKGLGLIMAKTDQNPHWRLVDLVDVPGRKSTS